MIERISEIVSSVCAEKGFALYDIQQKNAAKGLIFVIYITKINGVTIEDCKTVSKRLSYLLDQEDLPERRYFLEVSSPGLERILKMKKHYKSAINEKVKITFEIESGSRTEIGILKEVQPDFVTLEIAGEDTEIQFSKIKKAKTYFDYKKEK